MTVSLPSNILTGRTVLENASTHEPKKTAIDMEMQGMKGVPNRVIGSNEQHGGFVSKIQPPRLGILSAETHVMKPFQQAAAQQVHSSNQQVPLSHPVPLNPKVVHQRSSYHSQENFTNYNGRQLVDEGLLHDSKSPYISTTYNNYQPPSFAPNKHATYTPMDSFQNLSTPHGAPLGGGYQTQMQLQIDELFKEHQQMLESQQ